MNAKEYVIGALDKLVDDIFNDDTNYYLNDDGMTKEAQELVETVRKFQDKIDLYFDEKGNNK